MSASEKWKAKNRRREKEKGKKDSFLLVTTFRALGSS